jgi:hypothetical protein
MRQREPDPQHLVAVLQRVQAFHPVFDQTKKQPGWLSWAPFLFLALILLGPRIGRAWPVFMMLLILVGIILLVRAAASWFATREERRQRDLDQRIQVGLGSAAESMLRAEARGDLRQHLGDDAPALEEAADHYMNIHAYVDGPIWSGADAGFKKRALGERILDTAWNNMLRMIAAAGVTPGTLGLSPEAARQMFENALRYLRETRDAMDDLAKQVAQAPQPEEEEEVLEEVRALEQAYRELQD